MNPLSRSLLLLGLFVLVTASQANAQGRITFDETRHAFGTIDEGIQARHVFTFTNSGDAPLQVTNVRVSCGCTIPEWTNTPVAPGEGGAITVVFDSQSRPGDFERVVRVLTNGNPPFVDLLIEGHVNPRQIEGVAQGGVHFDTDTYHFEAVPADQTVAHRFTMQNKGEQPIRLHSAGTFSDQVDVAYPPGPIFTGEIVMIEVQVRTNGLKDGQVFDHAVVIETDDALQPKKSLRVSGKIAGSR